MRDLQSKVSIYLKAVLFLVIGFTSAAMLLLPNFSWQNAALVGLMIWSFCRAYYFAFYVIEQYIDPSFRYSGLLDFLRRVSGFRP